VAKPKKEFGAARRGGPKTPTSQSTTRPLRSRSTPHTLLRSALASEVLDHVKEQSPEFFEQLVLDVLRAMGYGGSQEDAINRLGQSGDEGVDGVIREDELGLDLIYVQAKRWQNPVGAGDPEVLRGSTWQAGQQGRVHHHVGVYERSRHLRGERHARVILVDGKKLARLMIDGVGVATARTYEIKRMDIDYFAGEADAGGVPPDPLPSA
jgi:restriction system protein